ncbi:crotonase/enoyl-CoA hydratase family protein [Parahaliea mediterranea]|uniref:Crotonase/enoyl-CoA hydratase family protein n=1 Tax=Parahaliea mediterranea TaxID=651086 RepID=A0A939DG11_9GAMM|nr:crotonase/enoyl-CoA hydratase family protein [Parahaliea mediterranea]MBN7797496.1 crotonase/enoyl-CoA hydratase family protein [Parahaliea mediterranea]
MSKRVIVDVHEHVAHVRLNRPEKMNALDALMLESIVAAATQLANDANVRCVVLSGEGRAFCAGLDISALTGTPASDSAEASQLACLSERTHGIVNLPQAASWLWRELPVPVIAAMHGVAFGGGCQISIGADMRYAAPDTRISIMEMKWGIVPDMGGTPFLQQLVADDKLRELIYTHKIVTADEAERIGLVTRVCENPVEAALETASHIAHKNPDAIRAAKRIVNNAPFESAADTLLAESSEQDRILGSANQREAVSAELEKRAPNYQP